MKRTRFTYIMLIFLLTLLGSGGMKIHAQQTTRADSLQTEKIDRKNRKALEELETPVNSQSLPKVPKRFVPNSNRAVWLAMVFPGAGQIYNRKYWKLPIVYGGFVGCTYALSWNNKMYKDYSQAYLDIMDDDPNTKSYEDFLPMHSSINGQEERFKEIFRERKDLYRRQRDLSIFCFIGVYLLSIIDAYVDAELSDFDITDDISLRVEPAIFNNNRNQANSVGLQCHFSF